MTYDDLISWAVQTLPNARAVEMADGEIAILTGYRETYSWPDGHQLSEDLVPIDLGLGDPAGDD